MGFLEVVTLATALLHREKRISCRTLARLFELDDACLEDLKFELVHAKRLALEHEDGVSSLGHGQRLLTRQVHRFSSQL